MAREQVRRGTELAKEQGLTNVTFKVMDALAQTHETDTFDLVWACESGEHMPNKVCRPCRPPPFGSVWESIFVRTHSGSLAAKSVGHVRLAVRGKFVHSVCSLPLVHPLGLSDDKSRQRGTSARQWERDAHGVLAHYT